MITVTTKLDTLTKKPKVALALVRAPKGTDEAQVLRQAFPEATSIKREKGCGLNGCGHRHWMVAGLPVNVAYFVEVN